MKKLLMSSAAMLIFFSCAIAQNQPQGNSNAQNFKVCKSKSGYYTCGKRGTPTTTTTTAMPGIKQQPVMVTNTSSSTGKVCKPSKKTGKAECYTTKYSQNLPVCREARGYYICGKTPNKYNSTFQFYNFKEDDDNAPYTPEYQYHPSENKETNSDQKAPENQSYKNINLSTASR